MSRKLRYLFHSKHVATWINSAMSSLQVGPLVDELEKAIDVILHRAQNSVSEITLEAILGRVIHNSSQQFPILSTLKLDGSHLNFDDFKKDLNSKSINQIRDAFHFLITELMFIIGNITAEQLTPLLHGTLSAKFAKSVGKKDKKDDQ